MRIAQVVLVLSLVVGMNPGLFEVFQDGMHLIVDGRTDHGGCDQACTEHGCSPTGHHCGCCGTMHMVSPERVASVPAPLAIPVRWPASPEGAPTGVRRRLPRPPTA